MVYMSDGEDETPDNVEKQCSYRLKLSIFPPFKTLYELQRGKGPAGGCCTDASQIPNNPNLALCSRDIVVLLVILAAVLLKSV